MEISCKGSLNPPPFIFRSYGTREEKLIFGHKKGKTKPPQNTKNGYNYYKPFRKIA